MLTIHTLTPDRIVRCALSLRDADQAELDAAGVDDPAEILAEALPACSWSYEAQWNDRPVFMYGVRPMPGNEIGIPWMLSTVHLEQAERVAVARLARKVVKQMRAEFPVLTNMVHADNEDAIKFIQWLGFDVSERRVGPGEQFRQFMWRRDV